MRCATREEWQSGGPRLRGTLSLCQPVDHPAQLLEKRAGLVGRLARVDQVQEYELLLEHGELRFGELNLFAGI